MSKGNDIKLSTSEYATFLDQYKKLGLFPTTEKSVLESDILDKVNEIDVDDSNSTTRSSIPGYNTSWTVFDKNCWSR